MMNEEIYETYFRHESGDAAELSAALASFLGRLVNAGVTDYAIDYEPAMHYTEVRYSLTIAQARLLEFDDEQLAQLITGE